MNSFLVKSLYLFMCFASFISTAQNPELEYFLENKSVCNNCMLELSIKNNSSKTFVIPSEDGAFFANYLYYEQNGFVRWSDFDVIDIENKKVNLILKTHSSVDILPFKKLGWQFHTIKPNQIKKIKLYFKFSATGKVDYLYNFEKTKKYFLVLKYAPTNMFYTAKILDSLKRKKIKIYDKPIISNKVPIAFE